MIAKMTDEYGNPVTKTQIDGKIAYLRRISNHTFQYVYSLDDLGDRFAPKIGHIGEIECLQTRLEVAHWLKSQQNEPFWGENGKKLTILMHEGEPMFVYPIDSTHIAMGRDIKGLGGSFTVYHIQETPPDIKNDIIRIIQREKIQRKA
jgi:hypothetical protein